MLFAVTSAVAMFPASPFFTPAPRLAEESDGEYYIFQHCGFLFRAFSSGVDEHYHTDFSVFFFVVVGAIVLNYFAKTHR